MKNFLVFIIGILCLYTSNINAQTVANDSTDREWNALIEAIIMVESGGHARAKNGSCVGWMQISPGCLKACNNLVGYKKFKIEDRYDRKKSIEMFNIFQNRYNPTHDHEKAARMWNGGPGYHNSSTNRYWNAVKKRRDKILNEQQ